MYIYGLVCTLSMILCNHAGIPQNEYQPVVEDQHYPDAALPRGSANHNATTSLQDEGEKERQLSSACWQPADASRIKESFTGNACCQSMLAGITDFGDQQWFIFQII